MHYSLFVYDLFPRENPQCFKSPTSGYSVNATQWQGQQIRYHYPTPGGVCTSLRCIMVAKQKVSHLDPVAVG